MEPIKFYLALALAVLAAVFFLLGLVFAVRKEKACSLISGFNFKSREERQKYDLKRMSADQRNFFLLCGGILLLGAGLTFFFGAVLFGLTLVVWLVLFFSGVHLDDEKAFGKYRIRR